MFNGESLAWPGVEDPRSWEPVVRYLRDPVPGCLVLLAAVPKRAPPEVGDVETEGRECMTVRRHCVVREVANDDLPQPLALLGD